MKKSKKLISVILMMILIFQIIMPSATAVNFGSSGKLFAEKESSRGQVIEGSANTFDLTDEHIDTDSDNVAKIKSDPNYKTTPIVSEVVELRSENTKHFRHADGTYTMATYPEPVHFKDADGDWQEINNTLVLDKSKRSSANSETYSTVASNVDVSVPQDFTNNQQLSVKKDGYTVGLGVKNINSVSNKDKLSRSATASIAKAEINNNYVVDEIEDDKSVSKLTSTDATVVENEKKMKLTNQESSVTYKNIFQGADLEYIVSSSKIKESIIVNQKQGEYKYIFSFSFGDLMPVKQDDGSIALFKDITEKEPVFVLEAPYMVDSANEMSTNVNMEIKGNDLTVIADATWINSKDRVFPVVIDPTITFSNNEFKDAYISTASKSMNYNTGLYNYAGTWNLGTRRTYMKFPLPQLPEGSVVTNAELDIKQYSPDTGDTSNKLYLFDLTGLSSWNDKKITWKNQPVSKDINGPHRDGVKVLDYVVYQTSRNCHYNFNITNAVKIWYENGTNNGLMLTTKNEKLTCHTSLYSSRTTFNSDLPFVTISYINNVGLEDYWSYETINSGRSGTTYVNDYNGSLTYIHNDLSMTGNRLPINISHVYNSNNTSVCNASYYNDMNLGKNFHLNLQEIISAISSSDSLYNAGYRYSYYDGDGTLHYFKTNNVDGTTKITNEYDTSVVLTTNGSNVVITDSKGNKRYFRSDGKLFKIEDSSGNTQTLTFSGNKITKVTDPVGRSAVLTYNADNQLVSITDPAGRSTIFTYDNNSSGCKLISITYPDGKSTKINYTDNSIDRITSTDNSYIAVSYTSTSGCGKRTEYVYKHDKAGTQFDYLKFQYTETNVSGTAVGNTLVTDKNGKYNKYLFDSYGRTTEITNKYSQTQYVVYGSDIQKSNSFNDVLDMSELQTISTNLLKNHGFERDGYWTALQTSSNGEYCYSTDESSNGTRSMKMELTDNEGVFEIDQDFDVKSDSTYTMSLDINIPGKLMISGNNGVTFGFTYCVNGEWKTDYSQWIGSTSGWERFSHTVKLPSGTISNCHVFIELAHVVGKVYVDNVQVEKSGGSRYYNLVENSDFLNSPQATTSPTGASAYAWTSSAIETGDGVQVMNGKNYFLMAGSPNNKKKISQNIPVNADAGDTLIIGGKAAAYATVDNANSRKFGMLVDIYSTETTKIDTIEIPFDRTVNMDHQTKASYYKLTTPCHHIVYSFVYYNQLGNVSFDNAFVYVGSYGDHYEYNDYGNLVAESNDEGTTTTYTYGSNNADLVSVKQTVSGKEQTIADIEYDNQHNAKKITNNIGTEIALEYVNGQIMNQTVTEKGSLDKNNSTSESTTYIQGGNYIKTFTDANGGVTTYTYDNSDQALKGLVVKIEDPNGNVTHYTYDPNTDELLSVSGNANPSSSSTVSYSSQNYLPKSIVHNGMTYSYDYDDQNRIIASKVGSQTLVSNTYDGRQRLSKQTYANGDIYSPVYDSRDRISGEKWNNIRINKYYYNENDRLSQYTDLITDKTYKYDYAFYGLVHRILGSDGTKTLYDYDRSGQLSHYDFAKNDEIIYSARFTNNEKGKPDDAIISSLDNTLMHYNYDGFSRLTGYSCGPLINSFEYDKDNNNENSFVRGQTIEDRDGNKYKQFEYSYDANGNIISITESTEEKTLQYTYDGLNRLVSESNGTDTFTYVYDEGGNISSIKKNGVTLHDYTYGNTTWSDQLTAFDGKAITYDQNGNPLSYNGYTFSWQRGNQLSGIHSNDADISYVYDSQGHRVSQIVNDVTTEYLYSGDLLMRQSDGANVIDFAYDSTGSVVGFNYNDTAYFYMKNFQGDVIAVIDSESNIVAEYEYDSYGNILSMSGEMAVINPIRYRGYYYDSASGLYYLKSRYYNPEWRRFLNADSLFVAGDDAINGCNMYAYCYDNPVMYVDIDGTSPESAFKVFIYLFVLYEISAGINDIHYKISQNTDRRLGIDIMTPIANIFMDYIHPVVAFAMELLYSKTDKNWRNRDYPFGDIDIDGINPLQLRTYFPKNMAILAPIGAAFLDFHLNINIFSPNWGNYTTLPKSYQWQKDVGYNWWYDWFFNLGGPIGKERFAFEANNKYYVVWCWKGDYWNLGAGAEIGIYFSENSKMAQLGYYDIDTKNLNLKVCMNVIYGSSYLTTDFEQTNWWVTSFSPRIQSPNVDLLKVNIEAAFIDKADHRNLFKNFYTEGVKQKNKGEWSALKWTNKDGYQFVINSTFPHRKS